MKDDLNPLGFESRTSSTTLTHTYAVRTRPDIAADLK